MNMKKIVLPLILIISSLVLSSCGYHSPYAYSGPSKTLYIPSWHNRTNELLLDAKIYQSMISWFQKSDSITINKGKDGSQLILAGEIVSIDLPSLSYGSGNDATEVKVLLTVRYILKDVENDKILFEVGKETWSEEYKVGATSSESADNEKEALTTIIDDLSEKVYIKTLDKLAKQNK